MKNRNINIIIKIMNELLFTLALSIALISKSYAQNSTIIDLDNTHQTIRGFGAANIMSWRPDMTAEEINTAFGTDDGQLGFSILRLRVPSDKNTFSINLPTATAAHSMGVTLIASPWSPPASMKTNSSLISGELSESRYADYAVYLKSFADYMSENGAPIYAISVQNEPDVSVTYESCNWNPSQMLKFVKENARSIGTKVIAPESFHFAGNFSDPLLNDPAACSNFDILGGHIYGGGLTTYPLAESKGKEVWMTEHLVLETSWPAVLATGGDMNNCMLSGMSAYVWWYIVRFYGPIFDEGSDYRTPPGAVKGEISKRGYVMSQFARFIRPGYYRIECNSSTRTGLSQSAYRDITSSKMVIVAINASSQTIDQTFTLRNGHAESFTPYVTSETKNCNQENRIDVSDSSFTVTLEESSITTFVSDGSTGTVENSISVPASFMLHQNYPNPFNPETMITYQLSEINHVRLSVFNILGEEIASLVNERQTPGLYHASFNLESEIDAPSASGVYFYTLETGGRCITKKMLYLR